MGVFVLRGVLEVNGVTVGEGAVKGVTETFGVSVGDTGVGWFSDVGVATATWPVSDAMK